MVLNPGCTIDSLRKCSQKEKRPGLTSIDADLLFWDKARAVGQFKNYSGDSNMQPGPRISACVWGGARWAGDDGETSWRKRSRQKLRPSCPVCYERRSQCEWQ